MSRQTRLIVILTGMALVGVVALGLVANRYSRVIASRQAGAMDSDGQAERAANRQVVAFVRVRKELCARIDEGDFEGVETAARELAFNAERDRACAAARLGPADYRELRQRYRQWRRDPAGSVAVWRAAFDAREPEFRACDLGEFEALDR
jgi:hypothetical protein